MKGRTLILGLVICCLPVISSSVRGDDQGPQSKVVAPDSEYKIAQELGVEGPTETTGIESSILLGIVPLAAEFLAPEGYLMRVRDITVLPGGQIAVHQHTGRPGVAYMIEGELIEHKQGASEPLTYGPGAVALETDGTIHWWENKSTAKARALVIDIVPVGTE